MSGKTEPKIPRVLTSDVWLRNGESLNLLLLSDAHLESAACNIKGLKACLQAFATRPNAHCLLLGDTFDLVVPADQKRWRPKVQVAEVDTPDWINQTIRYAVDILREYNISYDLVIPGNHEDELLKRHGIDMCAFLAEGLGAQSGGYSGVIKYRLRLLTDDGVQSSKYVPYTVTWHHGAWGGKSAGVIPATAFFGELEGWDLAVFGHNHTAFVKPVVRRRITGQADIRHERCYLVNAGSWVESYGPDASNVHYAEKKGYSASLTGVAPIATITLEQYRNAHGNGALRFQHVVAI